MANIPLINGVRHSWASIEFNWLGRTVTGINELSFGIKQEKKNFHGAGNEHVHRGRGNKDYELKCKLAKYEIDAAEKLLADGQDLTDIDIHGFQAAFLPTGDDALIKKAFDKVEVTEYKLSTKQGDMEIMYDVTFICSKIRTVK
jgi:hypothetical protein